MNTKNKKSIIISAIIALSFLSGSIISCNNIEFPARQSLKDSTVLPAFSILLKDTTTKFDIGKIPTGRPILLIFFGPNCPYCDTLTRNILSHIYMLKDVRLFMLSVAYFHDTKVYEEKYQLNKYDNIMLGQTYDNSFNNFKFSGYPLVVVCDRNKKIKLANIGPLTVDTIRAIIDK
ncbi:Thioredoxin-like domain-containing protein [Chitinophaga sp. YR573]|uniref:TlpA family protein disulfide reductase n=1 Tax=Chitinophaga sp. YR573 TaxID=1881040 RepID=UPI0008BCD951|nr:thioredoxin fold domain-containing protein [Chitinophaga sp. YR573]SEW03892.1 Thioredoxin-like domain-containing protein [Chitinophaga sp. YR573]